MSDSARQSLIRAIGDWADARERHAMVGDAETRTVLDAAHIRMLGAITELERARDAPAETE